MPLVWAGNNTQASLGVANVGVGGADPGPPTRVHLAITMPNGDESSLNVSLGDTFALGAEIWRFADIDFESRNHYAVCLRRVDADEPQDPPSGRIWHTARLDPYGSLDHAEIAALEAQLGQKLPSDYRRWLMTTNGAQPGEVYKIGNLPFVLTPERPLLGVHPEFPPFDLLTAQQQYRDSFLSRGYLVIAIPEGAGGLLAVQADWPMPGSVWYLPPSAMSGWIEPAEREKQLVAVARNIGDFIGRLEPYVLPDRPPAEITFPVEPGPDSPWYRGPQPDA
jgi:uncharacterized protein DUF6406/SMI1/KNR4 family protein SUKH-1